MGGEEGQLAGKGTGKPTLGSENKWEGRSGRRVLLFGTAAPPVSKASEGENQLKRVK